MAVLLMLMYKRRGVLTNRSISTVYTFGAPSVFCEDPAVPPWLLEGSQADEQTHAAWVSAAVGGPCMQPSFDHA